jgi:acetyl esterase/lipase
MSLRLTLLNLGGHLALKPVLSWIPDPLPLRRLFERFARASFRPPPHTLIRDILLAPDLPALIISNRPGSHPPRPGKAILYFHGGAFMAGSPHTHSAMLARISRLTRSEVVAPFYRLAPEHPFPAAPEDARAAWEGLRRRGYRPEDIVLGGDSAGGNLALGLLAALLAEGLRPAGLFAFSPVTDLTFSGQSIVENVRRDPLLPARRRSEFERLYLRGAPPGDVRASPLFAAFPSPPPVFLQYSESEILRDDSRRMAETLRAMGGRVELDEWRAAPHVWVLFDRLVPEAREGLTRAARFIKACFGDQA